jgi:hypothetical protein
MTTLKRVSELTGLKPVLTFDQLQAKCESLEPKLPDNPSKATLVWNSMAVQQFVGLATENNDRERDMQLLDDRQNMIRQIAVQNSFAPHDVHNAMHVLDPWTHEVPHYDIGDDDDVDMGGGSAPPPNINPHTNRPWEPDWFTQSPRGPPPDNGAAGGR